MAEPINKGATSDKGAGIPQSAIASALAESQYVVDEDIDLGELEDELDPTVPAQDQGEPSTAQATQASEDDAEEETPADIPDTYWGVDLTGIPPERRADIISHLEQQDSTIRKLQDRLSTPAEREAPAAEPEPEVTDEQLLQVLGLDPEATFGPERNALVTMARNQLALEEQVTRLSQESSGNAVKAHWERELETLETTYGALPGTREQQLRYAAEENLVSPADLYFKLSAPVKREVESLASAARRDAEKRVQGAGVRPRSSAAEPAPVKPGMSMRDAVKAAALSAQKETGLSWKQAVKRVMTGSLPGDETQ